MTALTVGVAVAVALLGFLVAGLLRAHAEVLRTLHQMGIELDPSTRPDAAQPLTLRSPSARPTPAGPDAGDVIDVTGSTPRGDAVSLAVGGVRHDTLLSFLTSGCATCRGFWEAFRSGQVSVPGGARLVVVTRGNESESPGAIAALAGSATVVMSNEAWEHYDIPHAPYFIYISGPAGRVVGEGVAARWDEVKALMADAVADGTNVPPAAEGSGVGRRRSQADQRRDSAVDAQLRQAGIEPGDVRLYPTVINDGGSS